MVQLNHDVFYVGICFLYALNMVIVLDFCLPNLRLIEMLVLDISFLAHEATFIEVIFRVYLVVSL